jgi:hypothetical protein
MYLDTRKTGFPGSRHRTVMVGKAIKAMRPREHRPDEHVFPRPFLPGCERRLSLKTGISSKQRLNLNQHSNERVRTRTRTRTHCKRQLTRYNRRLLDHASCERSLHPRLQFNIEELTHVARFSLSPNRPACGTIQAAKGGEHIAYGCHPYTILPELQRSPGEGVWEYDPQTHLPTVRFADPRILEAQCWPNTCPENGRLSQTT